MKRKKSIPLIIHSDRSGPFEKDGHTVGVSIYKLENIEGWTLEVVDEANTSIVWDEEFATDDDAWLALMKTLDEEGIELLVPPIDGKQMH